MHSDKQDGEYIRLDRKLICKGSIINFYKDEIQLPNGKVVHWDYIGHYGAAACVPVMDDGRIVLVRQYRFALDQYTLELPAGGRKTMQEATEITAARELEEETGYCSENLEYLTSVHTAVAFCNEKIDIYVARDLQESKQNLDEDEIVEPVIFSMEQLLAMIYRGEITDAKTVSGLLAYHVSCQK